MALFIVGINAIAQRNATLGGWIASLPLVTVLSIAWLSVDRRGDADIARFLTGVLWGLVPTALFLIVTSGLLIRRIPLSMAFAIGFAAWVLCSFAAKQLGLLTP